MNGALFIFKNAANDSIALFGKDLSAIDASAGAVALYFNSQDSSGADVNSVALSVTSGKENQVVQLLGELARGEGIHLFDDEVAGNDFPSEHITGITSITLNGVPGSGVFAQQRVINVTADKTIEDSEAGSLFVIDVDGCAITMPQCDADAVGQVYDFVVGTSQTSTNVITITLNAADDYKGCLAISKADGSVKQFHSDGSDTIITLNASTKGGLEGGRIRLYYGEEAKVYASGQILGSGTLANSFS